MYPHKDNGRDEGQDSTVTHQEESSEFSCSSLGGCKTIRNIKTLFVFQGLYNSG